MNMNNYRYYTEIHEFIQGQLMDEDSYFCISLINFKKQVGL